MEWEHLLSRKPLGKSYVIDWEHHWSPEKLWRERGGRPGEVVHVMRGSTPSSTLHERAYRLDIHLKDMDRAGIDIAVLSSGGGDSLEVSKFVNDSLSQVMQQYPGRFVGLASVLPLGGKEAFAELERAVKVLGLPGVVISSQVEGLFLDAPQLRPFYEKVDELDIPIFVHVTSSPRYAGYDALESPYDLSRTLGRNFDLVNATTRLIFGGVLDDFPRLKFVMAHLGGGIAALSERMEFSQSREPIPGQQIRAKKPFPHYFDDTLYFDTAGFQVGIRALRCALTTISPQHMVFATDYPFLETMKPHVDAIRALDIDEEAKEGILGRNAAKLLKLPII